MCCGMTEPPPSSSMRSTGVSDSVDRSPPDPRIQSTSAVEPSTVENEPLTAVHWSLCLFGSPLLTPSPQCEQGRYYIDSHRSRPERALWMS